MWENVVTQLVTYPLLYLAIPFFGLIYPIIDLYYILSFQWDTLWEKLRVQSQTFASLIIDIFIVPLRIFTQLLLAIENMIWLWWRVFAWWVRISWIAADFLYFQLW